MDTSYQASQWARSEFGHADLGDARNVARLVAMGTRLAEHPHAKVAEVFDAPAALQAAYDFLENPCVPPQAIVASSARATAQRAAAHPRVLIPCDGVSLTLRDLHGQRGTGSVGRHSKGARGIQVFDAVALNEQGTVLGLAAMIPWIRPLSPASRRNGLRPLSERESRYWLHVRHFAREALQTYAPHTERVFLHDSGADAWPVLIDVLAHDGSEGEFSVIRAAHNRRAFVDPGVPSYLWPLLKRSPQRWRVRRTLGAGHGRRPRRAHLEVRVREVTLDLKLTPSHHHHEVSLWAVQVREVGRVPKGEERLEWLLLSNWPTPTRARALTVIDWYMLRWRVEDHHKSWKGSGADIEQTQLRSVGAIERWMAMHAAVSARALALVHQARDPQTGPQPAAQELSESELIALRALRTARGMSTPLSLSIAEAVVLIAILGGYMPAKNRRPGPKILSRGLERLIIAATAIEAIGPPQSQRKSDEK